jgi:DNA polymerase I
MKQPERLYLLDGMALAYRAYFAFIGRPLINSKGLNTSAIYGFVTALMKILSEKPDHIAVVFDTPQPTFRHKLYAEYKATRQRMPEDMAFQLDKLKEVVRAFNTPSIELPGYEADDVIGTLARRAEKEGVFTYLVTGDKDFMQLISPLIRMYKPGKAGGEPEIVDETGVEKKFGVAPEHVVDVLALIGDSSDNVPGVKGVGEKTAIPLIQKYGSLEELYNHIDEIPQKGLREKLSTNKETAFLSKELVTIETEAPVSINFHELRVAQPDSPRLTRLFEELEFKLLADKIRNSSDQPISAPAPASPPAPKAEPKAVDVDTSFNPAELNTVDITSDKHDYHCVTTEKALNELCAKLKQCGRFVIDTETTSTNPLGGVLVGLSFSTCDREGYYVPVRMQAITTDAEPALFADGPGKENGRHNHLVGALDGQLVLKKLKPILEDPSIGKIGQNIKYDMLVLMNNGIQLEGVVFDTMVGSYILRADGQHNLDSLALGTLNYRTITFEDLVGKGKNQKLITEVPLNAIADYSAEDADITMRLYTYQVPELRELGLLSLCEEMEFPLIPVLARMECAGISLDVKHLEGMSKEMDRQLQTLIADIHREAGASFNINSTQQLGDLLFNKLKLPTQRKTKTGFSTDVNVLESLRGQHPIIEKLLDFRQVTKLKSTYVDALGSLINPATGRVHTSFNQTVAATGRLSSSDPNLQNIPIRTEIGRSIRAAFVPAKGMELLSADYSQIELRIMAHVSRDPGLVEAFKNNEDIHATTAAKVFGVDAKGVTRNMRRKAKEVNFGIMYGIGPFGLAARLGIPQNEAREIIARYFERFPNVKQYINDTIATARQNGYVTTLYGRRRYFADINSRNQNIRANAERAAINMPIQGTAADMIKVAMIRIDDDLRKKGLKSRMLLQVHDELVFEIAKGELEELKSLITDRMQNAMTLTVPVKVEIGLGKNWLEAH